MVGAGRVDRTSLIAALTEESPNQDAWLSLYGAEADAIRFCIRLIAALDTLRLDTASAPWQ